MTNMEYIEKNNISFFEAMKMFNISDIIPKSCEDYCKDYFYMEQMTKWLKQQHYEKHKFEVGDFIFKENEKDRIGVVIDVKDYVYFKRLNRRGLFDRWGCNCGNNKYHRLEHDVYYMKDETLYKKVF